MGNVLQFKRGVEADRSSETPAAGEPLWVTDEKKLYVGDGSTSGGIAVGAGGGGGITWRYETSSYTAVAGDGVLANISSGTITLPSTLTVGDEIIINNMHSSTLIVADNGHTIRYKGVSYTTNITLDQGETVYLVAATTGIMEIT